MHAMNMRGNVSCYLLPVSSVTDQTTPHVRQVLSNLCAVQSRLVGQKFEVKVNDVRFVGHPISIQADHRRTSNDENKSTIHLFHIVFALWVRFMLGEIPIQMYFFVSCL